MQTTPPEVTDLQDPPYPPMSAAAHPKVAEPVAPVRRWFR